MIFGSGSGSDNKNNAVEAREEVKQSMRNEFMMSNSNVGGAMQSSVVDMQRDPVFQLATNQVEI